MKYFWIALTAFLLLAALVWLIICLRKRYAAKKVCTRTDTQKCTDLNAALEPFGFRYDLQKDLFCSKLYSWQREMGYCKFYDETAPALSMVIDSEPFYFWYSGCYWLIEVWKGQYGMSAGSEIGIYKARAERGSDPKNLFYESVSDEERLLMSMELKKNGRVLFETTDYHWWLTGFKLGEFSRREELSMAVRLNFPNVEMRNAFCEALMAAGYAPQEICIDRLAVSFVFDRPKSVQGKRCKAVLWWIQKQNRANCRRYLRLTNVFRRTIDRVDYIGFCFPILYRRLIRIGKSQSIMRGYRKINKRKEAGY